MGACEFSVLQTGSTIAEAFRSAVEDARHESGHGGYSGTIAEKGNYQALLAVPVPEAQAHTVAEALMHHPNINDKCGPAGAIPVVRGTRTITVKIKSGHVDDVQSLTEQALAASKGLRRGETIASTRLTSYSTPQSAPRYGSGYGHRPARATFTDGTVEVVINKAPSALTRTVTLEVALDATLDWDVRQKAVNDEASKLVRLKAGETIVAATIREHLKTDAKVTVQAPKAKPVTRYIIESDRTHGTWATGFPTQAEARAYATALAKNDRGFHDENVTTFDVVGVTKRETGEALVTATRTPGTAKFRVEVVVLDTVKAATQTPDAWLFFGYASH